MSKLVAACILVLAFGLSTGHAQDALSSFDPTLASELVDALAAEYQRWQIPGVSASVIVEGQGLWNGVVGTDSPLSTEPITPDMLFGIASITKTITATTILLLAEEGRLNLDDPIGDWVPPLRHVDPDITIRQTLNHTSGINNHTSHFALWDSLSADHSRYWEPEEIFDRFVGLPFWEAGTAYRYSNSNYLVLGLVIEAAAGPVATAIRDRIWTPYGLDAMYLSTEEELSDERATGWTDLDSDGRLDDTSDWFNHSHQSMSWSGGAVYSTSEDLARFGEALFTGQILTPESMEEMLTFVDNGANGYGLGVIRYRPFGVDFIGHAGNTIGYSSFMVCSDERGICAAALMNRNASAAHEFVFALIERILAFQGTVSATEGDEVVPVPARLSPSYPNPASTSVTVPYTLVETGRVRLTLHDMLGRTVRVLDNGVKTAGEHKIGSASLTSLPALTYIVWSQAD